MKKTAILFTVAISVLILIPTKSVSSAGPTEVSGIIESDTIWRSSESPYIVTGNVQVLRGVRLTIEPGVEIRFNLGRALNIDGELIASGTLGNRIIFTSNDSIPEMNDWEEIRFLENSIGAVFDDNDNYIEGSIINYSTIEYSRNGIVCFTSPYITNSIIQYNTYGAGFGQRTVFDNNLVDNNNNGISVGNTKGESLFRNNTFSNSYNTGLTIDKAGARIIGNIVDNNKYGISCYGFTSDYGCVVTDNIITNNTNYDNSGRGLFLWDTKATVNRNRIFNNAYGVYAVVLEPDSIIVGNDIYNNSLYNCYLHVSENDILGILNWWGTTDENVIEAMIYDYYDLLSLGKLIYKPYRTEPIDLSDTQLPTATVTYSSTEPTNIDVVATIHPSETVTILNNNGKITKTFQENGSFTFEFIDAGGNIGYAEAVVNNIDKTPPTASISYSTTEITTEPVIATLEPNEEVIITNNNGLITYAFSFNGNFIFEFVDLAGNQGSATALVDNIINPSDEPENPEPEPSPVTEPIVKGEETFSKVIVTGTKKGGGPEVRIFTVNGELLNSFNAYNDLFRGGVNVAIGDIDGDGSNEIITAPGIGGGPQIRIFDLEGKHKGWDFFAYDSGFRGGVNIAVGDVDGGKAEIITAPMSAGGPNIRIFGFRNGSIQPTTENFMAYDSNFRGGVAVSVGDLDSGKGEIVTTPISRGGPHIRIFGYRDGIFKPVVLGIMAYAESFRGGINSTTGDIDGNGTDEIITGIVKDGGPHVRIFGRINKKIDLIDPGFMAYDSEFRGGISVTSCDLNDDGKAEIITGVGSNSSPLVRIFSREGVQILPEFMAYNTDYKNGITITCGELR